MGGDGVSSDEFDWVMELITAVLFMVIGIIGITRMVLQLQYQTEVNSRVDKVRVSSIDQSDADPFVFTGYQAYMFSWMMDGHDDTALYWFSRPGILTDDSNPYNGEDYIGLDPSDYASGFIVLRNRAIIGADEYEWSSVKKTLHRAAGSNETEIVNMFRGLPNSSTSEPILWYLDFTANHVGYLTTEYLDESETQIFEERKDYIWSLHPCGG